MKDSIKKSEYEQVFLALNELRSNKTDGSRCCFKRKNSMGKEKIVTKNTKMRFMKKGFHVVARENKIVFLRKVWDIFETT